jgi:5-amino-6-(5-phosphoribosylamino)uracil reductase
MPLRITNVMAVSLDGRIASHPGERDEARHQLGFTNDDDHAHVLALLRATDAVIVGSASLMASGGAFVGPNDRGVQPIWAVLTNRGLPEGAPFLAQAEVPRWIVSQDPLALPAHTGNVHTITCAAESPAWVVAKALADAGVERALLFGGSEINRLFYAAGLVDQLILTVCPVILATQAAVGLVAPTLPAPVKLTLLASQPQGNLVFLTYNVQKD